ncbi:hypothetical protein CEQ90_08930 [Lewinellaceae bacterium SD302]|nr:hypothetical protein CEQ90_08930 [Lewinellaceae bacterium SD302]
MRIFTWLFILLLVLGTSLQAQTTISGYLTDEDTGEPLLAATVLDVISGSGVVANTYGFYSLTLPGDSARLRISYIGSRTVEIPLFLKGEAIERNVALPSSVVLEAVEVTADRGERIEQSSQMSRNEVPVEQIKRIPALLGEVDVLKALQLLPGVQSGGEGTSGLYVRGGSPDQNLVLLDGVPVYNVSHLLGIFSVFNADALRNVTLTKGGFPARYGGRLSSVLEINMKEGNLREWRGEGSIGLISSKLTLSGPLQKDKTSVLISGRRTYADLIFGPLVKSAARSEGIDLKLKLYFYDVNAKIQHKINEDHRLFLSFYGGADVFSNIFKEDDSRSGGGVDWGNTISAARWNWRINPKLFLNTTATYSRYNIDIEALAEEQDLQFKALYRSGIYDLGGKLDFDYIPNPKHYIRFGGGLTNHTYRPGAVSLNLDVDDTEAELDTLIGSPSDYSNEMYVYVEDDINFGALRVNAGLHFSAFSVDNQFYTSLQPRLGLRYLLQNDLSLKASFSTMQQYINLLTSESLSLPTDLWVPSTGRIAPQESWQAAVGAAKTLNDKYELSAEVYYKQMKNVVSYREGASFFQGFDEEWEDKVTQGDGEAYGLELFAQKKRGRLTGWIGYTLSWNWRQFDELNSGGRFPFRYDRRHDLSIVANYDLSDRVWLSGAFVYGTGNAVSLPTYAYNVAGARPGSTGNRFGFYNSVETGVEKNSFRMSDYHRMDLSISFRKQKRWGTRTWVIGAYNAYWHRNPYYIEVREDVNQETGEFERQVREISILPFIPSISYQFKF